MCEKERKLQIFILPGREYGFCSKYLAMRHFTRYGHSHVWILIFCCSPKWANIKCFLLKRFFVKTSDVMVIKLCPKQWAYLSHFYLRNEHGRCIQIGHKVQILLCPPPFEFFNMQMYRTFLEASSQYSQGAFRNK